MPTLAEEVDGKFKQVFDTFCKGLNAKEFHPNMEQWLKEFFRAGYNAGYVAFRERVGEG
jgi:hypothetical protein